MSSEMAKPPKIFPSGARAVPIEVLPPVKPQPEFHQQTGTTRDDGPPIHALSALVLVAVDSLWALFDLMPPVWIVAIPLCFIAVFFPTFLIQKHFKRDSTGRALAIAALLATLAAVPTPVTGTPVGLGLLAWSGLGKFLGRFSPKQR
jgi:hypothetical protein